MCCVPLRQEPINQFDLFVWVEVDLQDTSVGQQHRTGFEELRNGDVDADEGEVAGVIWLKQVVPVDQDAQHVPEVLTQLTPKLPLVKMELDAEFRGLGFFVEDVVEQGAQ